MDAGGSEREFERRLALLENERAILRRLYSYPPAIDYGGDDAWANCFTEDGVFDVRDRSGTTSRVLRGRVELADFAARFSRPPERWHKHLVIEPLIDVEGQIAHVSSYFAVLVEHDGAPRLWVFGRYHDTLARETDGAWRFSRRIVEVESVDGVVPLLANTHEPGGAAVPGA